MGRKSLRKLRGLFVFVLMANYCVYILYAEQFDKYYIGQTNSLEHRLVRHNEFELSNTFTAKYRPWILKAWVDVGEERGDAMKLEKRLKSLKSKKNDRILCRKPGQTGGFCCKSFFARPSISLAQLVRVPMKSGLIRRSKVQVLDGTQKPSQVARAFLFLDLWRITVFTFYCRLPVPEFPSGILLHARWQSEWFHLLSEVFGGATRTHPHCAPR